MNTGTHSFRKKSQKHFSCPAKERKTWTNERAYSTYRVQNKWNGAIFVKLFPSWIIHYVCLPIKRHVSAVLTKPFSRRWRKEKQPLCLEDSPFSSFQPLRMIKEWESERERIKRNSRLKNSIRRAQGVMKE